MTPEEQIATYRDIIKEAKAEREKLMAELAELKKKLSPVPTTTGAGAAAGAADADEAGY